MADSVIKISADFGQFVSGAKTAEAEVKKLSEELKALGVSYKGAMDAASQKSDALGKTRGLADELKKAAQDFDGAFASSGELNSFHKEIDSVANSLKTAFAPIGAEKLSAEFDRLSARVKNAFNLQENNASLDKFNAKLREVAANYESAVKPLSKGFETNRATDAITKNADSAINAIAKRNNVSVESVKKQLVDIETEAVKAQGIFARLFGRQQADNSAINAYRAAIQALHNEIVATYGSYQAFVAAMSRRGAVDSNRFGDKIANVAALSPSNRLLGGSANNVAALKSVREELHAMDSIANTFGNTAAAAGQKAASIGKNLKAKSLRSDLNNISEGFGALGYNLAYLSTQFRGLSSAFLGLTSKNAAIAIPLGLGGLVQWRDEIAKFDLNSIVGGADSRGKFDLTFAKEQVASLAHEYGVTKNAAQEAFAEIGRAARLPANLIEPMLANLKKMQAYLGNGFKIDGAKRTLYELSTAFSITNSGDGLDALRTFLNGLNGLDEETKKQIENLHNLASTTDDYGKKTEYLAQIFDIVSAQAAQLDTEGLTPLNTSVENLKKAVLGLFEQMKDSGVWSSLIDFATGAINTFSGFVEVISEARKELVNLASIGIETAVNSFEAVKNKWNSFFGGGENEQAADAFAMPLQKQAESLAKMAQEGFRAMYRIGTGDISAKEYLYGIKKQLGDVKAEAEKTGKAVKAAGTLNLKPVQETKEKRAGAGGKSGESEAERYIARLREQYDQVAKMNELQRLEYDIINGKVKMNAVEIEQARELASLIVERKNAEEEARRAAELSVMQEERRLQLQAKIAEYSRSLASYFQADSVVDYAAQIAKFQEERNRIMSQANRDESRELRTAVISGATEEQLQIIRNYYETFRKLENVRIDNSIIAFLEWLEKDTANKQNWNAGFVKAIENVGDWGKQAFDDMQKAAENWISGMSDALADFVRTGKADFKSLANSILDDIARMASKQFIGALFESFSPKGSGGGGAGNAIVNFFKSLFGFASGGYTGDGGKYQAAGIVHKGEYVINADSVRRIGLPFLNALNGFSGGGYVSPAIVNRGVAANDTTVQVNIYNNTTDDVVARRNGTTGALDVIINRSVDAVAASIASGGAVASAMQGTYGLNRGVGLARIGR